MGEFIINGSHTAYTLEPKNPIPAGTYDLDIRWSNRFQRLMPHVDNVPGHAGIEIHWGNTPKDTDNCLVVGSIIANNFVGHSRTEFDALFLVIQDAVNEGPQTITYRDPRFVADGEVSV